MYELRHTRARFRAIDTGLTYDAIALIPAQRGAIVEGQPSAATWWPEPRKFAAEFELAANTDVLDTPTGWLILDARLADAIEATAGPLGPRVRVSLLDYELEPNDRPRPGGRTLEHMVSVDVPRVDDRVDPLRSRKGLTVFCCPPEDLPPVFRLVVSAEPIYVSAAAAPAFTDARGVELVARPTAARLDGCSAPMLRVRDGDPLDGDSLDVGALGQVDGHGLTALHHAAEVGNLAAARALLDAGADPNTTAASGVTPLAVAAHAGHAACVELLLERGADPAIGEPAAGFAALAEQLDLCARLYPLPRTSKGNLAKPLALAVRHDREDFGIQLASRVTLDPADLADGFRFALNRGLPRLALTLLDQVSTPTDPAEQATLLQAAARSGSTELVDALLGSGVPVDAATKLNTALTDLCDRATLRVQQLARFAPMIDHLLSRGADPTLRPSRRTAIEMADGAVATAAGNPSLTAEERATLAELAARLHAAAAERAG